MRNLIISTERISDNPTAQPVSRRMWVSLLAGLIGVVLFGLAPAQRVWAADSVYTKNIPLTATDFVETLSVPKFDSTLGVLERVEISFTGQLRGSVQFESLDSQPSLVTTEMVAWLDLEGPDGSHLASASPTTVRSKQLQAFDGVLDFDGPSGGAFNNLVAADVSNLKALSDPADLALFRGPGTTQLTMRAKATASGSGAGNLALNYTAMTAAQLSVKYIYQAATNPAISLEKYTNGEDADIPTGPLIQVGQPVIWTYTIQNSGDAPLVDVVLVDDQEGTITCPQTTLAVGESMTCTASSVANHGQYANLATVTARTAADAASPAQTVSATDPSHYYGVPLATVCPVDFDGALVLPEITYLGEGPGQFALPDGYDVFVVKRLAPFRFALETGSASNGQQLYAAPDNRERVWACSGDCGFVPATKKLFNIGLIGPGVSIGAVILDDDDDTRINAWVADGDVDNPYQTIDNQTMVQNLIFDIPFEANWGFNANDSVGMAYICIVPTTDVRVASIWGAGHGTPQPGALDDDISELDLIHTLFLPIARR